MTELWETRFPTPFCNKALALSPEDKQAFVEAKFQEILEILGMDLSHPSLTKTPARLARLYIEEIFSGLDPANFPEVSFYHESLPPGEMIVYKEMTFVSFCEHHLVPFEGKASIGYIPKDKILGLSKLHEIVRYFAKRPQLQERLTAQIADCLVGLLETPDVAVWITARHFCTLTQSASIDSLLQTQVLLGKFENGILEEKDKKKCWEEDKPDSVVLQSFL